MPRPQFSEMLVNRRRQLGLSISQASQVLRLKEQVLIAFEEGDFDHIPKSGYAQGMLSSYARYLGLNPRQVVNQFQTDLNDYAQATRSTETLDSDATDYLAPKKLLPTSGGPAGDLGAFATTSQPHSRQQSSPLVTRRYVGTLHDEPERAYGYDASENLYVAPQTQAQTQVEQRYGTLRRSSTASTRSRSASSGSRRRSTEGRARMQGESLGRGEETTRREAPRRRGGAVGQVITFFSDRTRLIALGVGLVAVLLIGGIAFGVRSCSSSKEDESAKTVPVTSTTTTENTTDNGQATSAGTTADPNAANANAANANATDPNATTTSTTAQPTTGNAQAGATTTNPDGTTTPTTGTTTTTTTTTPAAPKETKVQVSVEAGNVSWVEVLCDGESKIATTVTGPWSETYDVHESITIEVGDTTAVVVTENGTQRQFDSKSSGIGTITIQGTPEEKPAEDATKKDEDAGKKGEDTDQKEEQSEQSESFDSSGDEFLYTYDGYDIYYNAENDIYYFYGDDGAMYDATNGAPL